MHGDALSSDRKPAPWRCGDGDLYVLFGHDKVDVSSVGMAIPVSWSAGPQSGEGCRYDYRVISIDTIFNALGAPGQEGAQDHAWSLQFSCYMMRKSEGKYPKEFNCS